MSYFEKTKLTDSTGAIINPATDESILLLRRIAKLLESGSTMDSSNRQRVVVDSAIIASGTVTTVSNISTIGSIDPRYSYVDVARNTYANGIRSKLNW